MSEQGENLPACEIDLYIGRSVRFLPGVEDAEPDYIESGMRARILTIRRPHDDEVHVLEFDLRPFEASNLVLETALYYDRGGVACLTAREAGHYNKGVSSLYLGPPETWDTVFTLIEDHPETRALITEWCATARPAETYTCWLERRLIETLRRPDPA